MEAVLESVLVGLIVAGSAIFSAWRQEYFISLRLESTSSKPAERVPHLEFPPISALQYMPVVELADLKFKPPSHLRHPLFS